MRTSWWVLSKWIKQLVRIVWDRHIMESWPDIDGKWDLPWATEQDSEAVSLNEVTDQVRQ